MRRDAVNRAIGAAKAVINALFDGRCWAAMVRRNSGGHGAVVTRPDGFTTFGAIRWLHGVGCALVQLDWDGTVLLATAPAGPDRPVIRRAQALAAGDKTGLAIMREILRCKLAGQSRVARLLGGEDAADLDARAVSRDRQHAVPDPAIEGVVGAHGSGSNAPAMASAPRACAAPRSNWARMRISDSLCEWSGERRTKIR